jgi:hypothetical protein
MDCTFDIGIGSGRGAGPGSLFSSSALSSSWSSSALLLLVLIAGEAVTAHSAPSNPSMGTSSSISSLLLLLPLLLGLIILPVRVSSSGIVAIRGLLPPAVAIPLPTLLLLLKEAVEYRHPANLCFFLLIAATPPLKAPIANLLLAMLLLLLWVVGPGLSRSTKGGWRIDAGIEAAFESVGCTTSGGEERCLESGVTVGSAHATSSFLVISTERLMGEVTAARGGDLGGNEWGEAVRAARPSAKSSSTAPFSSSLLPVVPSIDRDCGGDCESSSYSRLDSASLTGRELTSSPSLSPSGTSSLL